MISCQYRMAKASSNGQSIGTYSGNYEWPPRALSFVDNENWLVGRQIRKIGRLLTKTTGSKQLIENARCATKGTVNKNHGKYTIYINTYAKMQCSFSFIKTGVTDCYQPIHPLARSFISIWSREFQFKFEHSHANRFNK